MTVSKFCQKCGKMMWDVQPCKRFCDTCIKEKAKQKAKLNYEKKKAQQKGVISSMQAKKPDTDTFCVAHFDKTKTCRACAPTDEICEKCRDAYWNEEVSE